MTSDDNELIGQYLSGNCDAMEILIERYRRRLFGFIIRMTASGDDADEIFQEVWVKVIRKLESYRADNFAAWLMTLTRNMIIDRARVRKPVVSLDDVNESGLTFVDTVATPGPGPGDQAAARELGVRIEQAVAELPTDQREVFLMRTQMDLGFKAIAGIQGVSINTALARMQYALEKLKTALRADYDMLGRSA